MAEDDPAGPTWVIHAERLVDDTPHVRISQADVELPGGAQFTQYVFRMPRCVMTAVLDDAAGRILLIRRHRFIIGRWVWELPGGYADPGEEGRAAAVREAEEETGWRPRNIRFLLTYQPMIGSADSPQDLYLATGADRTGLPHDDESGVVRWVPLDAAAAMIARGQALGAATVIAIQRVLLQRAEAAQRPC